jgi:exonuclease SbcD
MAVAAEHDLQGAYVRVRWTIADEDRHEVDRAAIERVLRQAAEVKLEGRIVPVTRTRADGISRMRSVADKVATWARVTQARAQPLLDRLGPLAFRTPEEIAEAFIAAAAESASRGDGALGDTVAIADEAQAGTEPVRVVA